MVSCGAPLDPAPAFPASALRPPRARTAFPARHPKILCAFRRRRPKACPPGRQDICRKTHVRPVHHLPASELSCTSASRILTKSFPAAEPFGPSARVGHSPLLLHEGASELGEILLPGTARCKVGFPPGHPADIPAGQRGRTAQGTAPRDPPLAGRAAIRRQVRPGKDAGLPRMKPYDYSAGHTSGAPDSEDSRETCPPGQGRPTGAGACDAGLRPNRGGSMKDPAVPDVPSAPGLSTGPAPAWKRQLLNI